MEAVRALLDQIDHELGPLLVDNLKNDPIVLGMCLSTKKTNDSIVLRFFVSDIIYILQPGLGKTIAKIYAILEFQNRSTSPEK